MRRVIRYETSDGVLHETQNAALRHADERFGKAIIALAREAVNIVGYRAMVEFIERSIPEFVKLDKLKRDMILETNNDEN